MNGIEEMDLELARQHQAEIIREASLSRALSVASLHSEYAAGLAGFIALDIIGTAVRNGIRRLFGPRRQPAATAPAS